MNFIKYVVEKSLAKITLSRPDKFNSFNREMALELQSTLDDAAAADRHVRAILLTAEGKAFCAGQDLPEALDPNGPGIKKIIDEHYNPIIRRIRNIEIPVLCAVNGVAAGAGANIALACDVVVASASASFLQAFSKIGLIPDSGGTFFLPRLVGLQRASSLIMLGDRISADEALRMGMIYKVFDDQHLMQEASALASTLASLPTKALGLSKRLLNESLANSLEQQLERECRIQVEASATYDYNEGVRAFLEKRKPQFKGE